MKKWLRKLPPLKRNKMLYGGLSFGVLIAAVLYGDPLMFMTLYALLAMPLASLLFALLTLYGAGLAQKTQGNTVIKGEANRYTVTIDNQVRIGFGVIRCIFLESSFAVESDAAERQINIRPFMKPQRFDINFTLKYRGKYQLGLEFLEVTDFLGLFCLRRKITQRFEIVAYPRIRELEHMELAIHLLSKAPANLTVAQEDYADYTDVRPYEPSDPIKKVHWKLTAKRGEWIVKNFQSSVLNSMAILIDAKQRKLPREQSLKLEDSMMEHGVAVLRYCLRQQMPIDLLFGRAARESGRHIGDFEALYNILASLDFVSDDDFSVNDALSGYLNETSRNVNVVILTHTLDMALYEQVLNAMRFGHYIAIMYFVPEKWAPDRQSDEVFERLKASGINAVKI